MPMDLQKAHRRRNPSWVREALIWVLGSALLFAGLWGLIHWNLDAMPPKSGVVLTPSDNGRESSKASQSSPVRETQSEN
ncbi:MAG: hypothetical protein JNL01_15295 [Bdellovibrionales bacterium]|nr:hypothetical protein [Bdellovibrionales bacterium]